MRWFLSVLCCFSCYLLTWHWVRGITGLFNLRLQSWTKAVEKQLLLSRGLRGKCGTDLVYCWGALNSSWLHKSLVVCVNSQIEDKCTLCSGDALFEEGCLTSATSPEAVEKEVLFKRPFLRGAFWRYLVAVLYCNTEAVCLFPCSASPWCRCHLFYFPLHSCAFVYNFWNGFLWHLCFSSLGTHHLQSYLTGYSLSPFAESVL